MEYVQLVLTEHQVALVGTGLQLLLDQLDQSPDAPPGLADHVHNLRTLFREVNATPRAFPVTGRMARSLKVRARRLKGEAQRPPRPRRVSRHKRRIEEAKARRAARP